MQVNATPILSLPKSGAFGPYLRVLLSGGTLALAGANDKEYGTTKQRYLSTGLGLSNVAAVVDRKAPGTVKMIANGAIAQYGDVYAAASGKVSATANGNYIGIALTSTSADGDELEVLRTGGSQQGYLFNQVAASTAISNTTVETDFDQSFSIPANLLKAGDVLKIRAQVIATATNSTDTLTVKLKLGAITIIATAAVDVANSDIAYIEAIVSIRTAGAGGTFVASGVQALGTPGTVTAKPFNLASSAIDTTAANVVKAAATWSVANAGNSCRLDQLVVERVAA